MALELTELEAVTQSYFERQSSDIYFKSNVLLFKLLSKGKTIPGGKNIEQVLEYAASNAGAYGPTSRLPLDKKEVFNSAFFPWAGYYSQITIDLEDQRSNSGEYAIINLVDGKLKNAQKSIRTQMGSEIYQARADNKDPQGKPVGFSGLADLFNTSSTFRYGNIAPADMPAWSAQVITTNENISFKVMQQIRAKASVDDNMEGKPNLYITTQEIKDGFEASLQQQARYSDAKLVSAGFDNILFGGMPVVADNKQADGTMDALNLRFLDILTHSKYNFTRPKWGTPIDMPDTAVGFIRWSGQLVCKNRAAHCRHTNLTVA